MGEVAVDPDHEEVLQGVEQVLHGLRPVPARELVGPEDDSECDRVEEVLLRRGNTVRAPPLPGARVQVHFATDDATLVDETRGE